MNEKMRKSGINVIGNLSWGTHFCQFYRTKEELEELLAPFFKTGLENNEFCLWITSEPLDSKEAKNILRKIIPDFDISLENGQIEITSFTDCCLEEGEFGKDKLLNRLSEKLDQAQENGYEGLRLSWNTSSLKKEDWDSLIDFEKKMDSFISNSSVIALCTCSLNNYDITEILDLISKHQFTLVKKEEKWKLIENFGRKNTVNFKHFEDMKNQSEQQDRKEIESIALPARNKTNLEFSDIIDAPAIQSLMNDFYKLAHIPIGIIDLKGKILVSVGWQSICTEFHRVHPETSKHCVESDMNLSAGVSSGEFKLYKCKNNMWDIVTPIMVGGKHLGNIFLGQFFFEDELVDYEFYRSQARKYGFNEDEYLKALEKVPRLRKQDVDKIMAFFMKFGNMISQLSYSNLKLAQSLAERESLFDALQESGKREHARSEELEAVLDAVPVAVFIAHDPQVLTITGNRLAYEWLRVPVGTNFSKSAPEGERPETFKLIKDGVEIPPEKMPSQIAATGREINDCELDIVSSDGKMRHVLGNARPLRDEQGNLRGSISAFIDITERNKAEEALKKEHGNLEKLVEERTKQLAEAYNLLKKSEKSLAEAQKMAHIGHWEWDIRADIAYWSDEVYSIFGRNPQELAPNYDEYLKYIHPDDRDYFDKATKKAVNGKPYNIDYRIIRADGEERIIHMQSHVILDENHIPVRIKGVIQDITERKKAEKTLLNLEIARKKEIHHRIKNNLQVISSLLDLQAEGFKTRKCIEDSDVLNAFRESQNRIMSIALIHEELHEGGGDNTLNFSLYLERLVRNLFQTYKLENASVNLDMNLEEEVFFDMDTAVPLGIIVNELVSNSLEHAFPDGFKGEIQIKLFKDEEALNEMNNKKKNFAKKSTKYILTVSDNGIGISDKVDLENSNTLGLQLVTILIDQLNADIELKRDRGTEFVIRITV